MSQAAPKTITRLRVVCDECPALDSALHYSVQDAAYDKKFHNEFIHGGDDVADVEEVEL